MATIDDLVKATRSKRVQVADLPDAPKLQPTIRSGGQYTVAVQQAGRNKLMDLADALSKVNPVLKEYGAIADLELQQEEQRLAGLSPEALQKELKNTTNEFDSMSRKGGFLEWLTSPINEKRKRRALGKAAYGQFELAATARLNNPVEGDDKLFTSDIVEDEFKKFVEGNPALQGQYAGEGFREVVNPLINNLSRTYDSRKAEQSKQEITVETANSGIRAVLNADKDNFDLDMRAFVDDMPDENGILQESAWNSLNGMTPTMQRATISSMAKNLAKEDPIVARQFLNWAKTELKVGNALYGTNEAHVIELEDVIDDMEERNDAELEKEREDFVLDTVGQLKVDLVTFEQGGELKVTDSEKNEITIENKGQLQDVYKQRVLSLTKVSSGDKGRILQQIETVFKDDLNNGEQIALDRIYRNAVDSQPISIRNRYIRDLANFLEDADVSQDTKKHPALVQLAYKYARQLDDKIADRAPDLLMHDARTGGSMLNEFSGEQYSQSLDVFKDAILRKAERIEQGLETQDIGSELASIKLPPADEPLPVPESKMSIPLLGSGRERSLADIYDKSKVWYKTITSGDPRADEARKLVQQYMPELEESYGKEASKNEAEIEDVQRYFEVARFMEGIFTLDVLENVDENGYGYVKRGVKFNPKLLIGQENAGSFVLMSKDQLQTRDEQDTINEVERIIKAVDYKGSRLDFIRDQEALHKKIGSTFVEYKEPVVGVTPKDEADEAKTIDDEILIEASQEERRKLSPEDTKRLGVQSKIKNLVESTAKTIGEDSGVFNFDPQTIGEFNRWGTLISTKGTVIPFGGIIESPPEGYAGYMNYKQFRGAGKRKKLLFSKPIAISEFIEKINSDDAADELDLTPEQVEQYKKIINAADEASKKL